MNKGGEKTVLLEINIDVNVNSMFRMFRSLYNKRDHLRNYRETPFNSWAGKREEDVLYDSIGSPV